MSRRLELLRLLETYESSAGEGRAHAKMMVLARQSGDVLSRYHFEPGHFTTSGFVVSDDADHLLLVFHAKLGRWLQPGGHIEPADSGIEAAARREVEEETGLSELILAGDGLFDVDVHQIPAARGEPGHEHHDLRFLFRASGDPVPGDGVTDASWRPLDGIAARTSDRSLLRAAAKLTV